MSDQPTASATAGGGVGTTGLLAVLFIALKLTGTVSWPWIWVLAPLWVPTVAVFSILALLAVCYLGYVAWQVRK